MKPVDPEKTQATHLIQQEGDVLPPIRYEAQSTPMFSRRSNGDRVNDRFQSFPTTRDRNAVAKTLMDLGWTFDEVVAALKMEGE